MSATRDGATCDRSTMPCLRIGAIAEAGDYCPETGLWEAVAVGDGAGARREFFVAGTIMPGTPSRSGEVLPGAWMLVGYG